MARQAPAPSATVSASGSAAATDTIDLEEAQIVLEDAPTDHVEQKRDGHGDQSDKILRFKLAERLMHWSLAAPFLTCLTTAAILVLIYNPAPERPFRDLFSTIHRYSGVALIVLPPLAFIVKPDWRIHLANMKWGWKWSFDEIKWLFLMPLSNVFKSIKLPEEGKFNAAEKLNFMSVTISYPLMGLTGLLIWSDKSQILPWYLHFGYAVAAAPLVGGHMFMAIINPATRVGITGMFTGYVSRHWASHHYRLWYRVTFPEAAAKELPGHSDPGDTHQPAPAAAGGIPLVQKLALGAGWPIAAALAVVLALNWHGQPKAAAAAADNPGVEREAAESAGTSYLSEEAPLREAPGEQAAAIQGVNLFRGSQVTLKRIQGGFAFVEDLEGHTGFVPASLLTDAAPEPNASYPFPDCHRIKGAPDAFECLERANALLQKCTAGCQENNGPVCPQLCQERLETCAESCKAGLAAQPAKGAGQPKPAIAANAKSAPRPKQSPSTKPKPKSKKP